MDQQQARQFCRLIVKELKIMKDFKENLKKLKLFSILKY